MIERIFVESDASKGTARAKSHAAAVIDTALVDALKIDFGGQLILPGDAAYETGRRMRRSTMRHRERCWACH
jgi:hypothetical protein